MQREREILNWLVETIARETGRGAEAIDPDKSVHALGVDSALMISLVFELEDRFGVRLDPTVVFEEKSLRAFATKLAQLAGERADRP